MNFELTQEQHMIKKMTQEFAKDELLPNVVKRDIEKIWPKEQIKKMADLGLLGMMVEPEWGGNGMDTISKQSLWRRYLRLMPLHLLSCLLTIL